MAGSGFWMSFHELVSSYPWTMKRAIRVLDESPQLPARNPFAYVLAVFVPYAGRMGAGVGVLLYVYFVGILAAIALPAYQDYTIRANVAAAVSASQAARDALADRYQQTHQVPATLAAIGLDEKLPDGVELSLDSKNMVLTVKAKLGALIFVPSADAHGMVSWACHSERGLKPSQLPAGCR